jgi:hypothetical protein
VEMEYPWDIKVTDETKTQNSRKKLTLCVELTFGNVEKEEEAIKSIVRKVSGDEFVNYRYDENTKISTARVNLVNEFTDEMQDWIDEMTRDLAYSVHAKTASTKSDVRFQKAPKFGIRLPLNYQSTLFLNLWISPQKASIFVNTP